MKKIDGYRWIFIKNKKKLNNNFLLINGDTYFDINIYKFIKDSKNKLCNIALSNFDNYKSNNKLTYLDRDYKGKLYFNPKSKYFNGGIYF